jgi:photosystem II stability/assembly factor-like uncharacterized protein
VSYSRDSGNTWTRCNPTPASAGFCHALAVAPSQTSVIYAGGEVSGAGAVYRSTDFGVNWSATGAAPSDTVLGIAIPPADANRVLAATPSGTCYTTNGGANWAKLGGGAGLRAMKLHPFGADTIYVGGDSGISVSHDGGGTWTPMNDGLGGLKVTSLGFSGQDGLLLLAGTAGGACYAWELETGIAAEPNAPAQPVRRLMPSVFAGSFRLAGRDGETFDVLDHTGRKVAECRGDHIGDGLAAGVYFVRTGGRESSTEGWYRVVIAR